MERLSRLLARCAAAMTILSGAAFAADAANPYLGDWALTIPGGRAGWLGVEEDGGKLSASILWGGGSVLPAQGAALEGDNLAVTRIHRLVENKPDGTTATLTVTETITAKADGDELALTTVKKGADGKEFEQGDFTGKRIPPLPPAPDLSAVKFGEPVALLNGQDLTGWRLVNPASANGWSVQNGVLTNNPVQAPGEHKSYGNLKTDREFEDFNLTTEVSVPPGGNSGIYLRGIYEIQVVDSSGKALDPHNMGSVYSRITPSEAAEKPSGEWQTMDITLVDRHVTVVLNGKTIIDNAPLRGCTGGALWSDESKPGPIYLQGDHTGVSYRNMVLRPIEK